MKANWKDFLCFGVVLVMSFLLGVFLYQTQLFALCYREQMQLFVFDVDYVTVFFQQPGGLAILMARFLVQFFYSPLLAVVITTLVLFMITLITFFIIDTIVEKTYWIIPFCFLPALSLSISLLDHCFHYEGITSYLLMSFLFFCYSKTGSLNINWRISIGCLLTFICFYIAGSIALLFAFSAFLYDWLKNRQYSFFSLSYVFCVLLIGFIVVKTGIVALYQYTYTPSHYYEITAEIPFVHFVNWIVFPLCILGVYFISFIKRKNIHLIVCMLCTTIFFYSYWESYHSRLDAQLMAFYRYEYHTVREQWDDLLCFCTSKNIQHYNDANYMNLALVKKDVLADKLFRYPQFGPSSLIFVPKDKTTDTRLAHVLFAMGNMAAAQNVAFNSLSSSNGYNPTMLKMILQIDLMRGSYEVALKYIELLEKSFYYAEWASEQRKFLFNDELVELDPVLGIGRKSFPREEDFVLYNSPMDDLYKILDTNPANKKAMEYALSYLLLAKDINHVRDFIHRYYGTSGLDVLPIPAQEALIFYSDYYQTLDEGYALEHGLSREELVYHQSANREYCKKHGVSEETFKRFSSFKEAYGMLRQNRPGSLSGYEKTFWYYLLFTQI